MASLLTTTLLIAPLTGCVEKVRFGFRYDYPLARPNPASGPVAAYTPVVDGRMDRSVDGAFKSNPISTITDIVGREIQATLMFQEVRAFTQNPAPTLNELKAGNIHVVIEPKLEFLTLGAVNPTGDFVAAVAWNALLPGAGLARPIDMEGRATLSVRMIDVASGATVTRTYAGKAQDRMIPRDMEEGPVTERLTTRALKHAMDQLRADLVRYVQEGRLPPPGSPL